jgi:hypothetical protein
MKKRNETKWSITKLAELTSQYFGDFYPFIDWFFLSFMLCLTYFVSFCDTSFRFVSFLHFSFRLVLVSDLRPIDILTGEIAIEVTGVVGVSPALWYFRYRASIFLTLHKCLWFILDLSAFRSFSGFFHCLTKHTWEVQKEKFGKRNYISVLLLYNYNQIQLFPMPHF